MRVSDTRLSSAPSGRTLTGVKSSGPERDRRRRSPHPLFLARLAALMSATAATSAPKVDALAIALRFLLCDKGPRTDRHVKLRPCHALGISIISNR